MPPRTLAVVVHYLNPRATAGCVESIAGQTGGEIDLVVVDHSEGGSDSDPGTLGTLVAQAAAGATSLTVVRPPRNLGFAAGCNLAMVGAGRIDRVEAVWLVNPDVVAEPGTLATLAARLARDPSLGAVAPDLGPDDHPAGTVSLARGFAGPAPADRDPGFLSAACLLLRAEAVRQAGPMDERLFLYWEDVDYSLRLRAAGWGLAVERAARVTHARGTSVGNRSPAQDYYATRNALLVVRKHAPALLPTAALCVAARTTVAKSLRREWPRLAASARGLRDGLLGTTGRDPRQSGLV